MWLNSLQLRLGPAGTQATTSIIVFTEQFYTKLYNFIMNSIYGFLQEQEMGTENQGTGVQCLV